MRTTRKIAHFVTGNTSRAMVLPEIRYSLPPFKGKLNRDFGVFPRLTGRGVCWSVTKCVHNPRGDFFDSFFNTKNESPKAGLQLVIGR